MKKLAVTAVVVYAVVALLYFLDSQIVLSQNSEFDRVAGFGGRVAVGGYAALLWPELLFKRRILPFVGN